MKTKTLVLLGGVALAILALGNGKKPKAKAQPKQQPADPTYGDGQY
jgi:hypothetical protein